MKKRVTVVDVVILFFLLSFAFLTLYPFLFTLSGSLNEGLDYEYGGVGLLPRKFTLDNYSVVFSDSRLYRAFFNTVLVTAGGVFLSLLLTTCVAYAMANKHLKGKKFFWVFNIITMFFSGGMIPSYMLILALGLFDSFLVYILPAGYSVYNMIILSNFFRSIDGSIRESAVIDGANEFRIWISLYIPLSKPALATVGLWIAVSRWNSYLPTLLYTSKTENMWLLQYYLMRVIQEVTVPDIDGAVVSQRTISFAAMIVAVVPIVAVYPFISKFFTKGIMLGSLKG